MNTKTFKKIVSNFNSVAQKNSKLSVFKNKIFFGEGKMSVYTDSFKLTYNIDFKDNLTFSVDSKQFSGLIKSIKSSDITILRDGGQIIINGMARLDIKMLPLPEMFDKDFSQAAIVAVPDSLAKDIKAVSSCAANDNLCPVLNGVFFDGSKDGDYIVASDGHILSSRRINDTPSGVSFILPVLACCNFPVARELQYISSDGHDYVRACVDDLEIVVRGIDGRYPNWRSVINKDGSRFSVDKNDLKNAVDIAGSIGSACVLLCFLENVIRFFAADRGSENYAYATAIPYKPGVKNRSYISFNINVLSIIFKVLNEDVINVIFNGEDRALTIDNGTTVIIIMPIMTDVDRLTQYNQRYEADHAADTIQESPTSDPVPANPVDSCCVSDHVISGSCPVSLNESPNVAVDPVVACDTCEIDVLPENNHGLNPVLIDQFGKYKIGDFTSDFVWPRLNKNNRLREYADSLIYEGKDYYYVENIKIERIIHLSRADYRIFKNSLLTNYAMLGRIGGSGCDTLNPDQIDKIDHLGYLAFSDPEIKIKFDMDGYASAVIVTDGFDLIAVNTEGYGYARYVGLHRPLADRCIRLIRRRLDRDQISQNNTLELKLIDYSDKCIAVVGDTAAIKDKLKDIGGRFNPSLKIDGRRMAGWVFSRRRADQLANLIIDYRLTTKTARHCR